MLNAIRFGSRAKEEHGAIARLEGLHLDVTDTDFQLLRKANAWDYKITVYDALFVALAEQLGYPFITADDVLVRKLKGHSIVVHYENLSFEAN